MPDPAKTPEEIEDVLASVRRLVADHTAKQQTIVTPPPGDAAPAQTEALVLTPSFRVSDPEDPWVPVATADAAGDRPVDPAEEEEHSAQAQEASEQAPEEATEDLIAEIVTADAIPAVEADWQPDDKLAHFDAVGGADAQAPAPQDSAEGRQDDASEEAPEDVTAELIRMDGSEAVAADFEPETGDDAWPEGGAEAALLTLVSRRDPTPTPEPATEGVAPASDPEMPSQDGNGDTLDDAGDAARLAEDLAEETLDTGDAERAVGDNAQVQEVADIDWAGTETATDADADADDDGQGDAHGDFHWAGDAAKDTADGARIFSGGWSASVREAEAAVEDLGDTPSPFSFPEADEGFLDEDTLREIIVDVVRQELQGVLGQRITRNVRKMVRREIRLALAAEDLE